MEKINLLEAQINDKFTLSDSKNIIVNTPFLSLGEQEVFFNFLKKEGCNPQNCHYNSQEFFLYGGKEDCDRKILFILPSYLNKEDLIQSINNGEYIQILKVQPKNSKFADNLTHRDYLGALMNLGLKRDEFGDIYVKNNIGYIFVTERSTTFVKDNLTKIKRTDVISSLIYLKDSDLKIEFQDIYINVSANRLDAIIAEVFNLSRGKAQEYISKELVSVNDVICTNCSVALKENYRVSVRGKGKFKFIELQNKTRKDRQIVYIKKYI